MPRIGFKHSAASRSKISASLAGRTLSPEHCAHMGAARRGDNNPMRRPEVAAKVGASKRGKTLSPEHRAKISAAKSGPLGSKRVTDEGYILVKVSNEPDAPNYGWMMEHRHVMAQMLGRPLDPEEVVHHVDHDRANNARENLQLFESTGAHTHHHAREQAT